MVFFPGYYDNLMYEILFTILSSIIASAHNYTKILEEKEQLSESNTNLTKLSLTDEMTQLLNRRGFNSLGQQSIDEAISKNQTGLVIYGDMDGLKKINDTYGHNAGDRAIKAEAQLLKSVFRTSDVIGRLGGDEFGIISVGLTAPVFEKINLRLIPLCAEWNEQSKYP